MFGPYRKDDPTAHCATENGLHCAGQQGELYVWGDGAETAKQAFDSLLSCVITRADFKATWKM